MAYYFLFSWLKKVHRYWTTIVNLSTNNWTRGHFEASLKNATVFVNFINHLEMGLTHHRIYNVEDRNEKKLPGCKWIKTSLLSSSSARHKTALTSSNFPCILSAVSLLLPLVFLRAAQARFCYSRHWSTSSFIITIPAQVVSPAPF